MQQKYIKPNKILTAILLKEAQRILERENDDLKRYGNPFGDNTPLPEANCIVGDIAHIPYNHSTDRIRYTVAHNNNITYPSRPTVTITITTDRLKELLSYEMECAEATWKETLHTAYEFDEVIKNNNHNRDIEEC